MVTVSAMTIFPPVPTAPSPSGTPLAAVAPTAPTAATASPTPNDIQRAGQLVRALRSRFARNVIGQERLRESLIATMIAGGHILIESVPGLAKTTAAQTLANSVSGTFRRIQCTPDLMPSDLVGTQVFDFSTQRFSTQIGPIHANFVLLDEINRSSAKTQSAMLEAMAEGATTIGGQRIALPRPFMVIATQNPIEEEGTYNLPEAQMDRFTMKTLMTYPSADEEVGMLELLTKRGSDTPSGDDTVDQLAVTDVDFLRATARRVHVSAPIMRYAVSLAETSRGSGPRPIQGLSRLVRLGASPRASIALVRIGQAQALMNGRDFVIPEDLRAFAHEVFRHRVLLTFEAMADGVTSDQVVDKMIEAVPVP